MRASFTEILVLALAAGAGILAPGCGGDDTPAEVKHPPPPQAGPPPAASAPKLLVLKAKVDKQFRKDFADEDFTPDPTGDLNRDPFQSYLVAPQPARPGAAVQDECVNRTVAVKLNYSDLSLIGIVVRGNNNFAMFRDPQQYGQTAFLGDCLSKDKARIIEITPSCVRLEIRGEAPPGAPAPPAHEEKLCLHPEEIEIQ